MPARAPVLGSTPARKPRARQTAHQRGYDYRWQQERKAFLARNPLCTTCEEVHGRITAATEVDHVIPHKGDKALFWDRMNWAPICRDCHQAKTARENATRAALLPGWLPSPTKPLIVVVGPPRAGKTTHVAQHAHRDDLVLDLDVMAEEAGKPLWEHTDGERNTLLWRRNKELARFCEGRTRYPRCWLIATAGTFRQRKFWQDKGAELVVINPGPAVCVQRILADSQRPAHVKERLVTVARRWE